MADFQKSLEQFLLSRSDEENFAWAARQAYIALGTGIIAAAELKVDATPMEGFDAARVDELLGLKEKGLKSVVLLSLGYRDEEKDFLVNLKRYGSLKKNLLLLSTNPLPPCGGFFISTFNHNIIQYTSPVAFSLLSSAPVIDK
ncbi:nitroreductase family protein [Niabella sp. W65]|nr:nitroreductase family protein [Niabella sp. W65]MCH7367818.1 nitroreductase family protein [Niabella sp. W65]